ncbi:MAG TPA: TlpA disulfide reductase family protein [Pyrinomonadaceae bacterium]|nr:TlpA disulfide reductase family protein [Pyrinomonadaceae bacterium]
MKRSGTKLLWILMVMFVTILPTLAQAGPDKPKEVFYDANGNQISNNEFVDLRLANSTDKKDPAARTVLEDGTIEFRVASPRQEGMAVPSFDVPDIDAKWVNTKELKGKVIVLNFWFIGCVGCMDEIPKLSAVADKFKGNPDVVFLAVATNTPQELRTFLRGRSFNYRHIGQGLSLVKLFDFNGYPKNIVIGRDGKIVYWRTSIHAWDKFESVIRGELERNG